MVSVSFNLEGVDSCSGIYSLYALRRITQPSLALGGFII